MLKNNILYVFVFFFAISSSGQDLNTSPFSRYGIGELNTIQSAHYFGFGNISSALSEPQNININNPASYASFIQYNPIFNVSLSGKSALYNSNYNGKETNSTGNNFGLNTLFIGLPVKKNWGLVFGITPISSQGYNITNTVPFESSTVSYLYKGDGSINKLMIGNGFNFINKGDTTRLAFGINCSYLFGNLERTSSVIYNNSNNYNNSRIQYRSSLSGWSFDLGLQFYKKIETSSKNKLILNLGLNYVLGSDLISDNDFFAYSFIYNFNVQEIAKDTIEMSNEISSMVIPQKLDVGIAIGKIYKNIRRWDLGIQYSNTDWSNFNDNSTYSTQTDFPMGASSRISFGYRLSPNLDWANSNKSLISKSTYSFGLHQTKSQIIVDNESLINNGINFGVSIPMLNSRSLSRINFGFEFGKLGDLKSNNIEENYFKFSIGFSLGPDTRYDRWFRKRKYD